VGVGRREHPVLDKEFDVGDASRVLFDVEFPLPGARQLAAHALTHVTHLGAQALPAHIPAQHVHAHGLEALAQNNVKKIVSICPHCVRTIQEDWKAYGTPPEVEHHSEFLARFARQLPHIQDQEKIVFHDPCYLGRYRGVYEEPRSVAALAGDLVEAPRSHERSFCCGAGGGLVFLGEEKGERVSHVRAEELAATGASVVGTACPFCNTMFRDAFAAKGEAAPELMDIAQLAARGLPE